MSIQKKIIWIFSMSFTLVAAFGLITGLDFWETQKDFEFLKVSDSIRSQVLELRRHEKNLFLYGDRLEMRKMREGFDKTDALIEQAVQNRKFRGITSRLKEIVEKYKQAFYRLSTSASEFRKELQLLSEEKGRYAFMIPIFEDTFLSNPVQIRKNLKTILGLPAGHPAVLLLRQVASQQTLLRKSGEDIITLSRELDRAVQAQAQKTVSTSVKAMVIVFPVSFIFGFITIFLVVQGIVRRLNALMNTILHVDKGFFPPMASSSARDEVGTLIRTYNKMAEALRSRDLELKKKEAQLIQSKKLAAIGTLASGVAHELNNPLNNIHIAAQILKRQMGPTCAADIHEAVEDIYGQSLRVKRMVGDLLEFARYKDPQFVQTNLVEVIARAFKQVDHPHAEDGVRFTLKGPPRLDISADPLRMERVFLNLFRNAIEAMEGKGELTVEISEDEEWIRVTVRDTGAGMPQEVLEKIFDPFFTTKDKGTGLGLSIIYNIIANHHGTIRVESTEGRGTTFTIFLPRTR